MSLKPKTVRRITLLGGVVLVLLGGAFSLLVVRGWQNSRTVGRFAQDAIDASALGQPYHAMLAASNYLKRNPINDTRYAEVLKIYADARLGVEESDFSHIRQAIRIYQQYLARKPDDRETKVKLVDLFTQARFYAEAHDLAQKILPSDLSTAGPENTPVMRSEAAALLAAHTSPERLEQLLDRLSELQPLNVRNESIRLQSYVQSNRTSEARAYAESLLGDHPDDPRAELLLVIARLHDRRPAESNDQWERLSHAAGLDKDTGARIRPAEFPDFDFAIVLVQVFDQFKAFDRSLRVLEDASEKFADADLQRVYIRRLWQEARFADIERRLSGLDASARGSDADLLGFRALSLQALNRAPESQAIARALGAREGDFRATAWSMAIPIADTASKVRGPERVEQFREIVRKSPYEPVFSAMLGDALSSVGRTEDARRYWDQAAKNPLAAGWPLPQSRIAETLLAEGRFEEAAKAAREALSLAERRVPLNLLWIDTQAALIQRGSADAEPAAKVLARADETLQGLDKFGADAPPWREKLLPSRVVLLSRTGQSDKAKEAALGALRADPTPSEETLRRLVSVSVAERLGIEEECLARAESRYGQTASVVLTRALDMAFAGKPDEGLARLKEALSAHPADIQYQVALARYLERIGHPDAMKAWVQLGDANTSSIDAQRSCLTSEVVVADRAFVDRTIQRYLTIMGADATEDVYSRVARAKSLVHGSPTRRDRDEAVAILGALVTAQPGLIEPKLLLASILAISDPSRDIKPDLPRAIAQLADAAVQEPRSARIAIERGRLFQAQREWDRARDQLSRVAGDTTGDPDSRVEAARLLIAQGEPGPVAVATLSALVEQLGDRAPTSLLLALADAYAKLRQDDKACDAFARVVSRSSDPDSVLIAASFYSRIGDAQKSQEAVSRLEAMTLSPGLRELALARFAAEQGQADKARSLFEAAIAAGPTRLDSWRYYGGFCMSRADTAGALQVCERGLKVLPGEPALMAMREQARAMTVAHDQTDFKTLIEALAADPSTAEAAQALRLLQNADAKTTDDLVRLADRYPNSPPLQMYVARRVALINPDRAAVIAQRAVAGSPADPAPARLAAEIYLRLQRWSDMLQSASAWRARDVSRDPEADVAVAEAYLHLRDYDHGLEVIAPRVAAAAASAEKPISLAVMNIQGRLLVGAAREGEARQLLSPLLSSSRDVRVAIWLGIAGRDVPSLELARAWIEQAKPLLAPESVDEQLGLVGAYGMLASRFPNDANGLLSEAKSILTALADNPRTATAPVMETLGILRHRLGDIPGAEGAYRRAIELDPKRSLSLNNLASIASESLRLDEALGYAKRAVELDGADADPAHLDTLGQIYHGLADRAVDPTTKAQNYRLAADAFMRAAEAGPGSLAPLKMAASSSQDAGDYALAVRSYETMLRSPGLSDPDAAVMKNNLAAVLIKLKRPENLERARSLAAEAVRIAPQSAFFDTLAWAELLTNQREQSITHFRTALQPPTSAVSATWEPPSSSVVGLALALSSGTAEQRREAADLLGRIKPQSLNDADLREATQRASEALRSGAS